jgi:hypothetical protein
MLREELTIASLDPSAPSEQFCHTLPDNLTANTHNLTTTAAIYFWKFASIANTHQLSASTTLIHAIRGVPYIIITSQ